MFDKIAITDNKITVLRHTIEWQEQRPPVYDSETDSEKAGEIINRSQTVVDPAHLEEMLRGRNIPYTVTRIDVPVEVEQYDGTEWTAGWDAAVKIINGDTSHKIAQLKQALKDMDYKTSKYADGEYTQGEWDAIKSERKELRRRIHELEG